MEKRKYLIQANYETKDLPPPFKYSYSLKAFLYPGKVEIDLDFVYLERDEIDEEEIFNEGYTLDDDFKWKGELGKVWVDYIEATINETATAKGNNKDSSLSIKITSPTADSSIRVGNLYKWEYVMQELIQAVYEKSGKEAPLTIKFLEINETSRSLTTLHVSFIELSVKVESNEKAVDRKLNWEESRDILKTIYLPEYWENLAKSKEPKTAGRYIDFGQDLWYEFGVSAKNPGKKNDVLDKVYKIFKQLGESS